MYEVGDYMNKHVQFFIKEELIKILENALNKTLGEIDIKGDFARTKKYPKITGIAGDVVEHSLLGYPSDTKQEPDIVVDNVQVEVKTTGIKINKNDNFYEAKEPMSITAVSVDKIVHESFETSNFWHKLKDMLLIYYHYDKNKTVSAEEYANFYLRGYQFYQFSEEDKLRIMCDWQIVHDFIVELQTNFQNPEKEYSRISSELRPKLVCIDTAPKWPNHPRFRLKRQFVTKIVREHFKGKLYQQSLTKDNLQIDSELEFEKLPEKFVSYKELDAKCEKLAQENKGLNVLELLKKYDVPFDNKEQLSKSIIESIVTRMFGGHAKKISKVQLFNDFNIIAKTIVLTKNLKRTEDMKMCSIDFDEWCYENDEFEKSEIYDYFMNYHLLLIIFKETKTKTKINDFWENEFVGFKHIYFDDNFIFNDLKSVWLKIRDLVLNKKLKEEVLYSRNTNKPIINKNGVQRTTLNFPKSKDGIVFVRGTSSDSSFKPLKINGISMYRQYVWIKGKYIEEKIL